MKWKKSLKRRVLAWMITIAMVLSMAPTTAFAEELPQSTGCTHQHDESCGYVEAVAEVPCNKECSDTNEDDVIEHVEDCSYTPAVEGHECNHVHDESCGGLEEEPEANNPEQNNPGPAEPELSEELKALQESINALPTVDAYKAMTEEEQEEVYETAAAISEKYCALSQEDQDKLDITKMEELFAVINEGAETYDTNAAVNFLNSGYPYGKDMDNSQITLVIEVKGEATSYQWEEAETKDGTFTTISGATASTYTFTPTSGKWYRCKVDGTASEAVMAVKPGSDGRTWTKPNGGDSNPSWYIGNGTMAYMVNDTSFDVTGLYTKKNIDYMLCTSFGRKWDLYSSQSAKPMAGTTTSASLDAFRVSFDARDAYAVIFEADLADGQQAFSFGCDTQLGDNYTSGSYSDAAALYAMVKNEVLQQIAMIGAGTLEGAADEDPAFVIAPITPASNFWIGYFSSRQTFAYKIADNPRTETATALIDGQEVVTLLEGKDSGMTMSWMNIPSGGSVQFQFSVGDVAHTGAVNGKVNYKNETLTGLDPETTYIIKAGNEEYKITSNANGEIPLAGQDDDSKSYDFVGKNLTIAKQGSDDTPAEVEVAGRPDTPSNPSDLGDNQNTTPAVVDKIEIVELTQTSVTISPTKGQQYAYSTDNGVSWTTLSSVNSNGNYVIDNLGEGSKVKIRTRVAATSEAPASQWSEPTEVSLKSTVEVSASGWSGDYDGNAHSIEVTSSTEGATITYSSMADANYSTTNPTFVTAGIHTVYYRVTADGYYPAYGSKTITIYPGAEYSVKVESDENGTAGILYGEESLAQANIGYGSKVTLVATPNTGYRLRKWEVTAPEGLVITNNTFTMPEEAVTVKAIFEKIPTYTSEPDKPEPPTESYIIPVKNENTVQVEAEITDGSAKVSEITEDTLSQVVNNNDKESKVDTITIDLSGAKQEVTAVKLSKDSVETLAKVTKDKENGIEKVTIELTKATVELDNKTLETLVMEAKGTDIELVVEDKVQENLNNVQQEALSNYQVATTFEAYFTSDGVKIHDFNGGNVTVAVKFTPEEGKNPNYYHMIYIADDGAVTRYETKYENGSIIFTTTHFSDYAIIYDETVTKVVSMFGKLRARSSKQTEDSIELKWDKIKGADGYIIYGAKCNTKDEKYSFKALKTIANKDTLTWTQTDLEKGTYYKYRVKAYKLVDGKKVMIAASVDVHAVTKGGKYGVAKRVELVSLGDIKGTNVITVTNGQTIQIEAKEVQADKPIHYHRALCYESSNEKVATVTKDGLITAVGKGTCHIYVYAQNGVYKTVKVTVK